jgi:hypothetical protein
MHITPIAQNPEFNNFTSSSKVAFKHNESFWKSDYSKKDKFIVAGTTAIGVGASLLGLAALKKVPMKPKAFWNYLKSTEFLCKEVVAMGAGTCLGGLAGGYIIDKNPLNRKAKRREALMQIGNISIPIAVVAGADKICKSFGVTSANTKGKIIKASSSLGAILAGIYLANFVMNKVSNLIFKNKTEERGVKGTDLFPHIDDVLASAQYIAPESKLVHGISRIVPFALMVAGNEVGNKKAKFS